MYPLPATSREATPGIGPISAASSAAIFLGACRSCLASWKAAGTAISPKSLWRGCSMVTGEIDAVTNLYVRTEGARNLLFNGMKHGKLRV